MVQTKSTVSDFSVDLHDKSSDLVVFPLLLRPGRPALILMDFPSEKLPGAVDALVTRSRPGTDSNRSWHPIIHTSNRPEEKHLLSILT